VYFVSFAGQAQTKLSGHNAATAISWITYDTDFHKHLAAINTIEKDIPPTGGEYT